MRDNNQKLTGKFYHKRSWFGLVLYVEVEFGIMMDTPDGYIEKRIREYRKANESDAAEVIRWVDTLVIEYNKGLE